MKAMWTHFTETAGRNDKFQSKWPVTQSRRLLQLVSMEQSTTWEVDNRSAGQKIPRFLWNPKFHYRVHNAPLDPILNHFNPVHSVTPYFLKVHFNIILSTLRSSLVIYERMDVYDGYLMITACSYVLAFLLVPNLWESGCIVLRFPSLGAKWKWVVIFTLWPFYHRETAPCTLRVEDWESSRTCLGSAEKKIPVLEGNPACS
jgi:hypothetical protein